jgi:hypothetical protein
MSSACPGFGATAGSSSTSPLLAAQPRRDPMDTTSGVIALRLAGGREQAKNVFSGLAGRANDEPCLSFNSSSIVPRDLLAAWPQMGGGLHTTCVSEKREPVPDQGDRSTNIVEGVDTGYGLQWDALQPPG